MNQQEMYKGLTINVRGSKAGSTSTLIGKDGTTITKTSTMTHKDLMRQFMMVGFDRPYNSHNENAYRSNTFENTATPFMNFHFYWMTTTSGKIPSLEEFVNSYLTMYCQKNEHGAFSFKKGVVGEGFTFGKNELVGRASRALPSFYRELDLFYALCQYDGVEVEYDFQLDTQGIDLVVTVDGQKFYLASYVKTARSLGWKERKNEMRHAPLYGILPVIDVIADMNPMSSTYNCRSVNGINVYSDSTIEALYKQMKKAAKARNRAK